MSYPPVPDVKTSTPELVKNFISDLAARKEFRAYSAAASAKPSESQWQWSGFGARKNSGGIHSALSLSGLRLDGGQLFVANFLNPDTPYKRLLIKWQTGVGKSIPVARMGNEFIRQYLARGVLGERMPTVFVIGFTVHETIQEEMIHHPELGFVSAAEVVELRRLRAAQSALGPASEEARRYSAYVGSLRRRTTDRARGGYYQFYGYREFANRLFILTRQGIAAGLDIQALFRGDASATSEDDRQSFGELLRAAVRRGEILVNEELMDELRGGLLVADEIHDTFNIIERNYYGVAIQYVLDVLDEDIRAAYLSATPIGGSAAGIVDMLGLLVPRSELPGGAPLRRSDFFTRAAVTAEAAALDEDDDTTRAPSADGVVDTNDSAPVNFVVSRLREGALERIASLAAGRVSTLFDADTEGYPRREFVGAEVAGVPYLKLTLCPMSPFHERTLAHEKARSGKSENSGLAAGAYTLFDMAFPNPDFPPDAASQTSESYGLYWSSETAHRLARAPDAWKAEAGVTVLRGAEAGVSPGTPVISGAFLGPGRLSLYSTKMAKIVETTINIIRGGPGKIMVYHHRVKMSGVLAYQEAFRMHGIIDETEPPTDTTLCGVCGVERIKHGDQNRGHEYHEYTPARLIAIHGEIDRSVMLRGMAKFNSLPNLFGYEHRVVICSKIVKQGFNFRAVRYQLIASLPTDFSTLLQVFGRPRRKWGHSDLPEEQRTVSYYVFVTTRADGRTSPELQRYIDKGAEHLVSQAVERAAFHIPAIDGFANYPRIRAALGDPRTPMVATVDALPYVPLLTPEEAAALPMRTSSFEAYGHGEKEVSLLASVCRTLFTARPVWTYQDLWNAVRAGAVRRVNYDPQLFDEGNFALALASLSRPAGVPPTVVTKTGRYYIAARATPNGRPLLDIESYLRDFPAAANVPSTVRVRLSDFLRTTLAGQNFAVRLREFERQYLVPGAPSTPEMSLVEYGAAFHYALIQRLITVAGDPITSDDTRIAAVYRRFRVVITAGEASEARVLRGAVRDPEKLIGYTTQDSVSLYDTELLQWYNASHTDFGIGRRHRENNIVVGLVTDLDATGVSPIGAKPSARPPQSSGSVPAQQSSPLDAFAAERTGARFKLRPPIQKLRAVALAPGGRADTRTLARGGVCETRAREELEVYARQLRAAVAAAGIASPVVSVTGGANTTSEIFPTLSPNMSFAAAFDRAKHKRFPSAAELCGAIRLHLLALEENSRSPSNGMAEGTRWLYLFPDRPPTISALMGTLANKR